ncbi:MAG: UDP-N-acetyl-D-glucosamine dehydrogenase [Nitrospirae bacterium GWD2_57_9]|nr:MAG: UDP-N-acetyl-D-glucosamine dehydrogenase [Nitrospirae bacterium GWD2_57_9]
MELLDRIKNRSASIGIIGLGYVGLPLAIQFVKSGFTVTGFDLDEEKVRCLGEGKSYINHISTEEISTLTRSGSFRVSADFAGLKDTDCVIICVPTPLSKQREPDLSYVLNTARTIAQHLRKKQLIVLESTTYPGTTDTDLREVLEAGGLKAGRDFFLAFSPEREDPNNRNFTTRTIPKIVGGYTKECLAVADALYSAVVERTVPVSSTRVAEAAKLLENIYRAVNIALVNELKLLFDRMEIDIYEVIEAAKTKPFGFQAFYPGPGLGGHCIPIDPYYLTWKAREYDFHTRFIELAGEINTNMPYYVVGKVADGLNAQGKCVTGSKILILGLSYKKDIDDTRESPSLKLMELLAEKGATVDFNDPYIPQTKKMRMYDLKKSSVALTPGNLKRYDCIVVATDHSCYDYSFILEHAQLVVDTRNATNGSAGRGQRCPLIKA